MTRTILKYQIKPQQVARTGGVLIEIPRGGRVVKVSEENSIPYLWVELDPKAEPILRRFVVTGTGLNITDDHLTYLGTAMCDPYVWHVFEDTRGGVEGAIEPSCGHFVCSQDARLAPPGTQVICRDLRSGKEGVSDDEQTEKLEHITDLLKPGGQRC